MFFLALKNLGNQKKRLALILLSLMFSIAALSTFMALKDGLRENLALQNSKKTALNQIRVHPAGSLLNITRIGENTSNITPKIIEKIRNIEGVKKIHRQITYRAPVSLETSLLGRTFFTDSLLFGIEKELVAADLPENFRFESPDDGIPLIISRRIVELYNLSVAPNHGLPPITEPLLLNKEIIIYLNYSTGFTDYRDEPQKKLRGYIAGFSDAVSLTGVSAPFETVQELNGETNAELRPSQLLVKISNPPEIRRIATEIEGLNLQTEYLQKSLSQIDAQFKYLDIALITVGGIIMLIAFFGVAATFIGIINERQKELGILRILGASKRNIVTIISIEALITGTSGSLLGLLSGFGTQTLINYLLKKGNFGLLEDYIPTLQINLNTAILMLIIGCILSIIAALIPTLHGAKLTPAEMIRRGL